MTLMALLHVAGLKYKSLDALVKVKQNEMCIGEGRRLFSAIGKAMNHLHCPTHWISVAVVTKHHKVALLCFTTSYFCLL